MSFQNKSHRFWNNDDDPSNTGITPTEYDTAGKAAYESYNRSLGVHDETEWEELVWATRHAWCEAARAARSTRE